MTWLVEQLKAFGSTESASGAVALAIIGAAITSIGWISVKIWDSFRSVCIHRKKRKEAMTHLFIDALNQNHNLKKNFSEEERERIVRQMEQAEEGYRGFIENYDERNISKDIAPYIAELSDSEIAAISTYLDYRGLFKQYYGKLATDQFSVLTNERKVSVLNHLFDQARDLEVSSQEVIAAMKSRHKFLCKLNIEHDTFMRSLRSERPTDDYSASGA